MSSYIIKSVCCSPVGGSFAGLRVGGTSQVAADLGVAFHVDKEYYAKNVPLTSRRETVTDSIETVVLCTE